MPAGRHNGTGRVEGGGGTGSSSSGPLNFVPEDIISSMAMEPSVAADFVHHNCVDFFSDSLELSQTMSLLSDAAMLEGTFRPEASFHFRLSLPRTIVCAD